MSDFVEVKTEELTGQALDWALAKALAVDEEDGVVHGVSERRYDRRGVICRAVVKVKLGDVVHVPVELVVVK